GRAGAAAPGVLGVRPGRAPGDRGARATRNGRAGGGPRGGARRGAGAGPPAGPGGAPRGGAVSQDEPERLRRWRLVLGGGDADGVGVALDPRAAALDQALGALYERGQEGGLQDSAPNVARWLGDVRELFPQSVVRVLQQDAIERLGIQRLLAEPELLD